MPRARPPSGGSRTCSTRPASPTASCCSRRGRRRSRSSAASTRPSTSSGSASSRPVAAAMPAARRRSATAPSRSRSSQPAARSRRSTRCSTATVDNAYALVRPPGHHALPDRGMGFCLFANVAVGVRHAQAARGIGRVAVVDWDVHHGNGTQAVFWDDPSVLAISLHQDGLYPARSGLLERDRRRRRSGHDAQRAAARRIGHRRLPRRARPGRRPGARGVRARAHRDRVRLRRGCARSARTDAAARRGLRRDDRAPARCGGAPLRRPARRLARGWLLGRSRAVLRSLRDRGALRPLGRDRRSVRLSRRHPGPGARCRTSAPRSTLPRRSSPGFRAERPQARPRPERELDADAAARPPRRSSRWPSSPRRPASTR